MICRGCEVDKLNSEFTERKDRSGRLRPYCKVCSNEVVRARYAAYKRTSPFKHKCARISFSARSKKLPFDLTPEYLESIWTGKCPVLGCPITLEGERNLDSVAELDKFIPEKGYIKGNVSFISRRANRLKSDASIDEIRGLLNWMESHEG
jgi:hypothetical protein